MCYDPVRDRIVLFGGGNPVKNSRTWEFDGDTWAERFPPSASPSDRGSVGMAYDEPRRNVVVFGGRENHPELGDLSKADTWIYAATDLAESTFTEDKALIG